MSSCHNTIAKYFSAQKDKIHRMTSYQLAILCMLSVQILNHPISYLETFKHLLPPNTKYHFTIYCVTKVYFGEVSFGTSSCDDGWWPIISLKYCATKVFCSRVSVHTSHIHHCAQVCRWRSVVTQFVRCNTLSLPIHCMRYHTPRVPLCISYYRISSRPLPRTGH